MTERHLHDDPPTDAQVAAAVQDVRAALDVAAGAVPFDRAASVVGVAGTVTTLAAMALGLDRYDPAAIHGARVIDRTGRRARRSAAACSITPVVPPSR